MICGIAQDTGGAMTTLLLAVPNALAVVAYDRMIFAYALLIGLVNLVFRAVYGRK